jgi:hypothetical protein
LYRMRTRKTPKGMRHVEAVMKSDIEFMSRVWHGDDIEWVKAHGDTVEELWRFVKKGEKVTCTVYEETSSFLGMDYYDTHTEDGYHCKVCTDELELKE